MSISTETSSLNLSKFLSSTIPLKFCFMPGVITVVTISFLPSFTILTSSDDTLFTFSSSNVIAATTTYGEYTFLDCPSIVFFSYLLFLEVITIFKWPDFPSNSEAFISFPSKKYFTDTSTGSFLSVSPL